MQTRWTAGALLVLVCACAPDANKLAKRPPVASPVAASVAGVTLSGIVLAPAGLVSNNGGSLVSDNGGGLVSNNGGSAIGKVRTGYRALALAETPLAGTQVFPAGTDGQPLAGVAPVLTDAAGKYSLNGVPAGLTVLVVARATDSAGKEVLLRAMTRTEGGGADVSVASSLVTAAILGKPYGVATFTPSLYDKAVAATSAHLEAASLPDLADEQALNARARALENEVIEVKQALANPAAGNVAPPTPTPAGTQAPATPSPSSSLAPAGSPTPAPTPPPTPSPTPTATPTLRPMTVLAGSGSSGWFDGPAASAQFFHPHGLLLESNGSLLVADNGNHRLRRINSTGNVTTVAGDAPVGDTDGVGTAARFESPFSLAKADDGTCLLLDLSSGRLCTVTPAGLVTTMVAGGKGLNNPHQFAVADGGVIYVANALAHRIARIGADGSVTNLTGAGMGRQDGTLAEALFNTPTGLVLDRAKQLIYVADRENRLIRRIDLANAKVETLTSTGFKTNPTGDEVVVAIQSLALHDGQLYGTAIYENKVFRWNPATGEGGAIADAGAFSGPLGPHGIAVAPDGRVYVSCFGAERILVLEPK